VSVQHRTKQNKTKLNWESNNATPTTSVLYQTDRETDTKLRKKKPLKLLVLSTVKTIKKGNLTKVSGGWKGSYTSQCQLQEGLSIIDP